MPTLYMLLFSFTAFRCFVQPEVVAGELSEMLLQMFPIRVGDFVSTTEFHITEIFIFTAVASIFWILTV